MALAAIATPEICPAPDEVSPGTESADPEAAGLARLLRLPMARVEPKRVEAPTWSMATLAGRLVELSSGGAGAALSFTAQLLHEAQRQGEPVAWVQGQESLFYPPDLAAVGVDLRALPVLRPAQPGDLGKIVAHLLRSGAFGLIVVDLGGSAGGEGDTARAERLRREALPAPLQSRLERTAALHGTCVLCLTGKATDAGSLGPLVSWRGEARRTGGRGAGAAIRVELQVLKDKRSAPGWRCVLDLEPVSGLV